MSRIICPEDGIDCDLLDLIDPHDLQFDADLRAMVESRVERVEPLNDIVHVVSKADFTLQGATSTVQTIPLAVGIDSRDWRSASLVVRIHSQTSWPAGSTLQLRVMNVLVSPDDPSLNVTETRASSQSIGAVTAPAYFVSVVNIAIGAQLGVFLRSLMSTTAGQQIFTMSVDLVGRLA